MAKQLNHSIGRSFPILFVCVIFLFCFRAVNGASPGFIWAKTAGGNGQEISYDLAVDTNYNCLVAGYFNSTNFKFDNIIVSNSVQIGAPPMDCFLAKYNSNGVVQWAKTLGGSGHDRAFCAAMDAQGNCYIAGGFASTNFFIGSTKLTNTMSNGNPAFFVAKFSPTGSLLWARCPDKNYSTGVVGLAVDASNNVCVAGSITGTNIIGGTNFVAGNYSDVLLLKYDSSGNLLWGQHPGGSEGDSGSDLAVDDLGNLYLSATFHSSNATFGSFVFTNTQSDFGYFTDIAVVKYDPNGSVLWAKQFGGEINEIARGIAVDSQHNCYITGDFQSSNIFIGNFVLTNSSFLDPFIAKLGPDGTPLWANAGHGDDEDSTWKIAVDRSGNSYIGGYFQSAYLTLDNLTLTNFTTNALNDADAFVAKYDTDGNVLWATQVCATNEQRVFSLAVADDVLFATGWTQGTNVYFGYTAVTNTYLDIFVTRLQTDFPRLQCLLTKENGSNMLQMTWPLNPSPSILEYSTNLHDWDALSGSYFYLNGQTVKTVPADGTRFYRLQRF